MKSNNTWEVFVPDRRHRFRQGGTSSYRMLGEEVWSPGWLSLHVYDYWNIRTETICWCTRKMLGTLWSNSSRIYCDINKTRNIWPLRLHRSLPKPRMGPIAGFTPIICFCKIWKHKVLELQLIKASVSFHCNFTSVTLSPVSGDTEVAMGILRTLPSRKLNLGKYSVWLLWDNICVSKSFLVIVRLWFVDLMKDWLLVAHVPLTVLTYPRSCCKGASSEVILQYKCVLWYQAAVVYE